MTDLHIDIPSRGRAESALRVVTKLLPGAWVYVDEREAETYLKAGHREEWLKTHRGLYGIGAIRNYMLERCPTEVNVQVDDDMECVLCLAGRRVRRIKDPARIRQIIETTAQVALDMNVRIFGWGNVGRPSYFRPDQPFSFAEPLSRAYGFIGKDLRFEPRFLSMCEADAVLRELMGERRIILVDRRYYWHCGIIFGNKGGLQEIRTAKKHEWETSQMIRRWGPYVRLRGKTKTGSGTYGISVKRRQSVLT